MRPILDACCGGKMMWFDPHNPAVEFCDIRTVEPCIVGDGKNARWFEVTPSTVCDFKNLPFADGAFVHVVFDPPHLLRAGPKGYQAKKCGTLPRYWQQELYEGFAECMRVLAPYGTLIFKWSQVQIPTTEVIEAIGYHPLYGHKSGKRSGTHWLAFVKGVSRPTGREGLL
jgi:tRNA G10  N-methylase Trm11